MPWVFDNKVIKFVSCFIYFRYLFRLVRWCLLSQQSIEGLVWIDLGQLSFPHTRSPIQSESPSQSPSNGHVSDDWQCSVAPHSHLLVAAGLLLPGELRPARQLRRHAVPRRGAAAVARAGALAGGREVAARGLRGSHRLCKNLWFVIIITYYHYYYHIIYSRWWWWWWSRTEGRWRQRRHTRGRTVRTWQ